MIEHGRRRFLRAPEFLAVVPGLLLTIAIALAATLLQWLAGVMSLSPLIIAMGIGMLIGNVLPSARHLRPGIVFSQKRLLRFAIILLGSQLTIVQLASLGWGGLAAIVATLATTFAFIVWAGRVIGVNSKLAELIAAGTSVCGASAVLATNTITNGTDEDVAYAIACVTVFGSLSMILFPILAGAGDMGPEMYGIWAGSSIHEVAQAVGAAFQGGEIAGELGTVAKLSRVMLLAPLIFVVGIMAARSSQAQDRGRVPVPWFVFGFLAMILANSLLSLPAEALAVMKSGSSFMLTIALAAMGLETDFRRLYTKGWRPLLLGALGWGYISVFSISAIVLMVRF